MKFNNTSLIICLCLIGVLLAPISVHAQLAFEDPLNISPGSSAADVINDIIKKIIVFITMLAASIALLAFLIAGTRYLLGAVGGEQEIQKAKQILFWSIVGLLIIGTSLIILTAVFSFLGIST